MSEPSKDLWQKVEPCHRLRVFDKVGANIDKFVQMLSAGMLYLLVIFLVQTCKVASEIGPREARVAT